MSDAVFIDFGVPQINDNSEIAFDARVGNFQTPFPYANYTGAGLWGPDGQGAMKLIALSGQDAPGANGADFAEFGAWHLTGNGNITFVSWLEVEPGGATAQNNEGIWKADGAGGHVLKLRKTDVMPNTGGATLSSFLTTAFNDSGDFAFRGILASGTGDATLANNVGFWSFNEVDGFVLAAREGNPAPDSPGEVYGGHWPVIKLNDAGDVAFQAVVGTTPGFFGHRGIWASRDGVFRRYGFVGDDAPGTNGADFGATKDNSRLNNKGDIAFSSSLQVEPGGATSDNSEGLWSTRGSDELTLIVRRGQAAAGTNGTFSGVSTIAFNDNGDIAFGGGLNVVPGGPTYGSDSALFLYRESTDQILLVAREGDAAPSRPAATFLDFLATAFNDMGHFAYKADLSDGSQGAWLYFPEYKVNVPIAVDGDLFQVEPDVSKVIADVAFSDEALNNENEMACRLTFTDGTEGIFHISTSLIRGDTDLDGDVDLSDLSNLAFGYGQFNQQWANGDTDGDGDVDLNDLGTLALNYGLGSAQAMADFYAIQSIPEPLSVMMLTGVSFLHTRPRSRR